MRTPPIVAAAALAAAGALLLAACGSPGSGGGVAATTAASASGAAACAPVKGDKLVASAGDSVTVEPGTIHRFENVGPDEARFTTKVSPALEFESFLETMFALAADGKTNKKGMPNPVRMAVIANEYFDDVRAPHVPGALQKAALSAGAAVGRLVGYTPSYQPVPSLPNEPAIAV